MKNLIQNYKDFIEELSFEVSEGVLRELDEIQVLRADTAVVQDYKPVIDWYYDVHTMEQELSMEVEDLCEREDYSAEEWADMQKNQEAYKKQYEAEKARLELVSVKAILTEMKQMVKLFK